MRIYIYLLLLNLICCPRAGAQNDNFVTYAGNSLHERFNDILALSDGTFLVVGVADNLNWIANSVSRQSIEASGIDNSGSTQSSIGFIMQLNEDITQISQVVFFREGAVEDISFIKTNSQPGSTANLFISGRRSRGYYVARLNNNFVGSLPSGLDWSYNVAANRDLQNRQPWDVDGNGRVILAMGNSDSETGMAQVIRLNAAGNVDIVPNWRYHYATRNNNSTNIEGAWTPAFSNTEVSVYASAVLFTVDTAGSLRSWSSEDDNTLVNDENGNTGVKNRWPMDAFFSSIVNTANRQSTMQGNANLQVASRKNHRIGAIAADKTNNDIYIGASINSLNPTDGTVGYVPFTIAYDEEGNQKWWNRMYDESTTIAQDLRQNIDALSIDYIQNSLLVIGRQQGTGTHDFWNGNAIAANPGANGLQNSFAGADNTIEVSWLGKFSLNTGILNRATYIAGNSFMSNTTAESQVYTTGNGNVTVLINSTQFATTSTAHQQTSPTVRAAHIRVYNPTLDGLIYSSALSGGNNTVSLGGNNTRLSGVHTFNNGVLVTGYQFGNDDGTRVGDNIRTDNTATLNWGDITAEAEEAIFAKLFFEPVTANFTFDPIGNCEDSITVITDASSDNTASWEWNFGVGATPASANTQGPHTISWSSSGTKTVRLIAADGSGQADTATYTYEIAPIPNDTAFVTYAGGTVGLNDTITMPNGADTVAVSFRPSNLQNVNYQYIWAIEDFNGTINSFEYSFTHAYTVTGTYNVSLMVVTEEGCIRTYNRTVFIDDEKGLVFSEFTITSSSVCANSPVVFEQVNDTNAVSWFWTFGEDAIPTTANTRGPHSVIYTSTGSKTATLTVGNGNIEVSHALNFEVEFIGSFSINSLISGTPTAPATYTFGPLFASTGTDPNSLEYAWNFGNPFDMNTEANTSSEMQPTYTFSTPGNYYVSLAVSSAEGCVNTAFTEIVVTAASNPMDMTPNEADFSIVPASQACVGNAVTVTDMSRGYSFEEGQTRTWAFIDSAEVLVDASPKMIDVSWSTPGIKIITLRTGDTDVEYTVYSERYEIHDYPNADFTISGDTCATQPTTLTLTANQQETGNIYEWDIGGTSTEGLADTIRFNALVDTVQQVTLTVTNSNGCRSLVSRNVYHCPANNNFVSAGINVSFSASDCSRDIIVFESASTGTIENFSWSGGFSGPGPHETTLTGSINITLRITYRNANNTVQTEEITLNVSAQ